jgi:hypothetical protein
MHSWGDEDFTYWQELEDCAEYIGKFCRMWGRIPVTQTKEKYGTVRVYCSFHCLDLQSLLFPGWMRVRGPYKLMTFPIFKYIHKWLINYQHFIYRLAYARAVLKWPMLREEILVAADWKELLVDL